MKTLCDVATELRKLDKQFVHDRDNVFARMATVVELAKESSTQPESGLGVPIGAEDRKGNPIHIGDTLQFDVREWGEPNEPFVITLSNGAIQHPGSTGDLSSWCEIVKKWDSASEQQMKG